MPARRARFAPGLLLLRNQWHLWSTEDATQRLILCWVAQSTICLVLLLLVGLALKQKDARR